MHIKVSITVKVSELDKSRETPPETGNNLNINNNNSNDDLVGSQLPLIIFFAPLSSLDLA